MVSHTPPSLCASCAFMREVAARRGQCYLLCQNPVIDAKYPRQPVLACGGYAPQLPLQNHPTTPR
jgi:hypothetical protein